MCINSSVGHLSHTMPALKKCHVAVSQSIWVSHIMSLYGIFFRDSLVTKQLLENVFKTFQNGWILVEMLSFLLVVFRFFVMEFLLVFIHENQQLKTNINEMFENGCK